MDRFRLGSLALSFQVGVSFLFLMWPILTSDFILAPHGGHVGWGWENLTSHTRDGAGMTWTRLKHHISIVLTQLHHSCPSIHVDQASFLSIYYLAALSNCSLTGLGFQGDWYGELYGPRLWKLVTTKEHRIFWVARDPESQCNFANCWQSGASPIPPLLLPPDNRQ